MEGQEGGGGRPKRNRKKKGQKLDLTDSTASQPGPSQHTQHRPNQPAQRQQFPSLGAGGGTHTHTDAPQHQGDFPTLGGPQRKGKGPSQAQGQGRQQHQHQQQQPQYQQQQPQYQQQQPQAPPDASVLESGVEQMSIQPSTSAPPVQQQQPPQSQPQAVVARRGSSIENQPAPNNRAPPEQRRGQKILIETNYLPITFGSCKTAIHYDVSITGQSATSRIPKKIMTTIIQQYLKKYFPNKYPAFDGEKNLYSPGPLVPSGQHAGTVEIDEGRQTLTPFNIQIKYAATVDLQLIERYLKDSTMDLPASVLQCVDIVFRHAAQARFIRVGRSFFNPPMNPESLGGGFELWNGIYTSAVLGWKPFLNVDVTSKGFIKKQNIVDLIDELAPRDNIKSQPLKDYVKASLKDFVKDLRVEFQIPNQAKTKRTYKINDVVDIPAKVVFTFEGKPINILNYFKTEKKYNIRFPHLPCLWVGNPKADIKVCLPSELCTIIAGQTRRMENAEQTSNLIKISAAPSDVRKCKIFDAVDKMKYGQDPTIAAFGMKVGNQFEKIEGRVIPPPHLDYAQGKVEIPRNGVWFNHLFIDSRPLTNWKILSLERVDNSEVRNCVSNMEQAARKCGMKLLEPSFDIIRPQDLKSIFTDAARTKVQLLMIVINPFRDHYSMVKQEAETRCGVLTQCIKRNTFSRMNLNTASMILLKINAKLNGTNHKLSAVSKPKCLKIPCMIMGADVTHPPPNSREPSIAAISASYDVNAYKYNIQWRIQPPKMEFILNLKEVTEIHLRHFSKTLNIYPKHIIMFRDGVSEGMFSEVRYKEITAIRAACSAIDPKYEPQITFIVVQKRHHTRFFPTDPRTADKNKNPPPGTCIDTVITSRKNTDFYLLSHASIRGTARPTRYQCIWDDGNMTDVEIEELAFYLCHLFTRCNRAVSYPAPTYYSHLGAERAKSLIKGSFIDFNNLQKEQVKLQIRPEFQKENPMFFV